MLKYLIFKVIKPLYNDPPSANSITRHTGFDVQAPYSLTILEWFTRDNCRTSTVKALRSASVSMRLTATKLLRHRPR